MEIFGKALLIIGMVLALLSIIFGLPGNFFLFLVFFIYCLLTKTIWINLTWLIIFLVIAVLAELSDNLLAAIGTRRFGGSVWGIIGAILGGISGGLWLGFIVPIPVICNLIGAIIGLIAGSFIFEWVASGSLKRAFRATIGAILGRIGATAIKIILGILMFAGILSLIF